MIFRTETSCERFKRINKWHRWFAWHPVSWDGGWAWLSVVERKFDTSWLSYEWFYRAPVAAVEGKR